MAFWLRRLLNGALTRAKLVFPWLVHRKFERVTRAAKSHQTALTQLQHRVSMLELASVEGPRFDGVFAVFDLLKPSDSQHDFARIGGLHDGGYLVPTDIPSPAKVLSIGVGQDDSADLALAELGAQIYQFDHTITASPSGSHPNLHFEPLGLGYGKKSSILPLSQLISIAGRPTWLMLDAEGAEWEAFYKEPESLEVFQVVCVEIHGLLWLLDSERRNHMAEALTNLTARHTPVVTLANNYAATSFLGGRFLPDVVEVTLIRNDLFRSGAEGVPDNLISPNNPGLPSLHPESLFYRQVSAAVPVAEATGRSVCVPFA